MWRRYRLVPYRGTRVVLTQSEATAQAQAGGIGLVVAGAQPKMAVLNCPCGCGEVLRVNLMTQMGRAWRARLDAEGRLTLSPSVNLSTGCRCHFILAANTARIPYDLDS